MKSGSAPPHPRLKSLIALAPALHQLLSIDKGLSITDLERQLLYVPGKYGALNIKAGDSLLPESISRQCMRTGELVTRRIERRPGWDYIGRAAPVRNDNGDVIGSIATVEAIKNNPIGESIVIGTNPAFQSVCEQARRAARYDVSVLILGETGTGKEVMARFIVEESGRRDKPFVVINCASIPPALFESEMFGYDGGAFTGANKRGRQGYFEAAHRGTIFLDEVGELDMNVQAKLLRVLESGRIMRVGGNREIEVDTRVIAATNRNLREFVAAEKFRADLYFRLGSVVINLPSLRSRREDIPLYVDKVFHEEARKLGKENAHIDNDALNRLCEYDFPGNIRELQNILKRALIASDMGVVKVEHIESQIAAARPGMSAISGDPVPVLSGSSPPAFSPAGVAIGDMEREMIQNALARSPNKSRAAKALGISRDTLYRKMRKYGI